MAEGRQRAQWQHTSSLMALLANVFRDPKKKAVSPSAFDPYAPEHRPLPRMSMKDVKHLFVKDKAP